MERRDRQRKGKNIRVPAGDVGMLCESSRQQPVQPLVFLDGDDIAADLGKRFGQRTVAGARIDDEIAGFERHTANERACDIGVAKKVLRQLGPPVRETWMDATHDVPPACGGAMSHGVVFGVTKGRRHRRRQQARSVLVTGGEPGRCRGRVVRRKGGR